MEELFEPTDVCTVPDSMKETPLIQNYNVVKLFCSSYSPLNP